MIHTINITQVGADNATWYALLLKYDQPEQSVMIAKFENYVFRIDAAAMSRGSLKIRSYERCFDIQDAIQTFYIELGRAASLTGYSIIFTNNERPIFDSSMSAAINRFPLKEAEFFATASIKRALDQVNGSPGKISEREKSLSHENSELRAKLKKQNRRKRPKTD